MRGCASRSTPTPARERELYELATDVLVHLHRHPPMPGLPPHGLDQWLEELKLFTDWYCPAVGLEVDADGYRAAWREVLAPVAADGLGPVTVLRDYHAENIMLVEGRDGVAHFGLLDFQDALAGHPAYDLASVLEDARRDVPPEIERAMIDRYVAATGHGEAFERAYWALAAQRNTRILGVFTRLWKRDGKPQLPALPAAHVGPARARSRAAALAAGARLVRCQCRARAPRASRGSKRHEPGHAAHCGSAPKSPAEVPRTAMIMAAGLGKRMRPLTATRPKPLIEVAGKALLDHVLDRLRAAGVKQVVVNVHYLADAVEAHLASRVSTGSKWSFPTSASCCSRPAAGWSMRADLIDSDPFLAVNSDNLWIDGPADTLKLLASHWDDAKMDALLLLVPQARAHNHKGLGDFHMTRDGPAPPPRAEPGRAVRLHRHPDAVQAAAQGCARRGRSRPTSCGTGRSRRAAASAPSTRACGSTSARPASIKLTEAALAGCLTGAHRAPERFHHPAATARSRTRSSPG